MKKLALLLGIVFCSNLFAAAATDDVQAARQIKGRIKPPAKDDVLIQTPFTWRMTGVTAADENKDHLAAFLAIMKNHVAIKIKQMNPPLLLEALTHLNSKGFRLLHLTDLDLGVNQNLCTPLLEKMLMGFSRLAPNLVTLHVMNCGFGGEQARIISLTMPQLTTLNIGGNNIGDAGAESISRMPQLTTLDIGANNIGDAGAESISHMPHLTTLIIRNNLIRDAGVRSISTMRKLKTLNLSSNLITDVQVEFISHMHQLTNLEIFNNLIGHAGAVFISHMHQLTRLNISGNHIGDVGAASISGLEKLGRLDISGNQIGPAGAASISDMSQLITLNIESNQIGDVGATSISDMSQLIILYIRSNHIGPEGQALLMGNLVKARIFL